MPEKSSHQLVAEAAVSLCRQLGWEGKVCLLLSNERRVSLTYTSQTPGPLMGKGPTMATR